MKYALLSALLSAAFSNSSPASEVVERDKKRAWEDCVHSSPWNGIVPWGATRSEVRIKARTIVQACNEQRAAYMQVFGQKKAARLEAQLTSEMYKWLREDQSMRICEDC